MLLDVNCNIHIHDILYHVTSTWTIIENEPTLRILWPEPPMVAHQRSKNLRDKLVPAKLTNAHPNLNNKKPTQLHGSVTNLQINLTPPPLNLIPPTPTHNRMDA